MSAGILVLDFTKREVRRTTMRAFKRSVNNNCREAGHIFASIGTPVPGQSCMCGDMKWQPRP